MSAAEHPLRLAVIGGGLTGAALIVHAAHVAAGPLVLEVIEPAAEIGRGIAYGTVDPSHRINVPTDRMSLFPDDPDHLTRWLTDHGILPDPSSTDARGHHYVPRNAYGSYVVDTVQRTLATTGGRVSFRHHRTRAISIRPTAPGWTIGLSNGGAVEADKVLLCTGHATPTTPTTVSTDALRDPRFVSDPWAEGAFAGIKPHDSVLVVGTGLTMADVLASLDRMGHGGAVTAISRRGLLALPQGRFLSNIGFAGSCPLPRTALGLLRLARRRVQEAEPDIGWQPIMDALRFELCRLWPALPAREQRRVARRLLPFWEVHRFRIAPQLHDLLNRDRRGGRLTIETASFEGLRAGQGGLVAAIRPRGGTVEQRSYDRVVLCTGPGRRLETDPLVAGLIEAALARPDAVGLGLAVDDQSRVIDAGGKAQDDLRAYGPLTRGSFGEMTGAPDIIKHITKIVQEMVQTGGTLERPEYNDLISESSRGSKDSVAMANRELSALVP